jgi:hypothetical protein
MPALDFKPAKPQETEVEAPKAAEAAVTKPAAPAPKL